MALYYYDRYYATYNSNPVTYSLSWVYTGQPRGKLINCYDEYLFNSSTGALSASGRLYAERRASNTIVGNVFYVTSGSALIKHVCIEAVDPVTWDTYNSSVSSSGGGGYYSRGSYITTVIAENGTYPSNSRHSDGYWYVRGSLANTAPTVPSSISVPELKSGNNATISWGASTDVDGNTINYYLERSINGGGYTVIRSGGTTRTFDDTILSTWNTVTYRVRGHDGTVYGGYQTSSTITVKHFPELKMRVDGTLKTSSDGWVRVDGVLRKINGIWIKVGGVLKKI